jgi:CubicO group peptidase (beta-lactamase class C family)
VVLAWLALTTATRSQTAGAAAEPPPGLRVYDDAMRCVASWAADHPDLVRLTTIGTSAEGRPLTVARIAANERDGAPEMYLGGGIHGSEGSESDALWMVERLLERADEPAVRRLLESRVLWVQPVVNPDGVVAHERRNARGVDLNRNFGGRWRPGASGSNNPGPEPFSEPESRAVRDFLRSRPGLRAYLDLHRSASLVIAPTTTDEDGVVNEAVATAWQELDAAMGGITSVRNPTPLHFWQLHGLTIDWVWSELGVVAFTWELKDSPRPVPTDDDPRWKGLLHLLEKAGGYPRAARGAVTFDFDESWREVVAAFREQCTQQRVVGASLMFVRGAAVIGACAFGDADRAGGRAIDEHTIYHWASITKTFTGITVMQLIDRGRLRLDQPIVELVPELREVHDPFGPIEAITIRHLMSHAAGFRGPTWPWGGSEPWHPHEPTRFAQLVAMMPYTAIEFAPGSRYAYSNLGIVFLGRAIEKLTGEDYEVHVDKNVLRPLGMTRSYFDRTPYHLERHRSHGYGVRGQEVEHLGPDFDTGVTVSNGGLNAPLPDMARYLAFLLGAVEPGSDASHVLARSSLEEMWHPVLPTTPNAPAGADQMGLTFFVQERSGSRFVSHTGGQRSFVTFFYVHPASGTGALGAFNTGSAGPVMAKTRSLCIDKLSLPMRKS